MILLTILVFILILGLLIFVHELGHFVMAKRAGMRVEEFGFGFPPRIFSIRRGETRYSINWIPLGGFVKITGEDGGQTADPKAFGNQSFGARFGTLVAGVSMNFLLGWFLLFLGFWVIGTPTEITEGIDFSRAQVSNPQISIVAVQKDTPAEAAGFKPGDLILSIDGRKFEDIGEMIEYSKSRAGVDVRYELKRGKEIFYRVAVPRQNPPLGSGPVGFAPAKVAIVKYPVTQALSFSASLFVSRSFDILRAFGGLIKNLFIHGRLIEGLSGPVGIAVLTRDFTILGFVYLVQLTATLSINLGVINAFPFPALDGGRVLFLVVEKIRGTKSVKWERIANAIGFALLIILMVAVTFRDVNRFSEQFKRFFERIL